MRSDLTEIVFILDRSGSMWNLADDTIGGYNSFIDEQKKVDGEVILTTVLFDDKYEILHNGVNLKDIKPITKKEYFVRGTTALLDAIGKTINEVGERLSKTPEDEKPIKVIFVITTDGYENSSKEFTQEQVKNMIQHHTEKYNWQFIFLGANIDTISTASSYGIDPKYAAKYTSDSNGTQSMYMSTSRGIKGMRGASGTMGTSSSLDDDWAKDIK